MTMCHVQEWQLSRSYFLSYFPLMVSDAISCLLHNLKTVWNILMILHSYVEHFMKMCGVQEWQLSLSYFLSYFPLMVSYVISCPLHFFKTVWNILKIFYSYVEQVVTMCRIQEWQLSLSYFLVIYPWSFQLQFRVRSIWVPFGIQSSSDHDKVSRTRITTLDFILSELFPLWWFQMQFHVRFIMELQGI